MPVFLIAHIALQDFDVVLTIACQPEPAQNSLRDAAVTCLSYICLARVIYAASL